MDTLSLASAIRPLEALANGPPGVLALITGIEGPSYRPLGAMMAVTVSGRRVGSLSSGCVEGDIAHQAGETLASSTPRQVRYGLGSPFRDIQLPCGGGLDVLLVPEPDQAILRALLNRHAARLACTLVVTPATGALELSEEGDTGWVGDRFQIRIEPEIAFLVFGKGPEAATFAVLARSAGFPITLLSPDEETLGAAADAGCETRHLVSKRFPDDIAPDRRTGIVLFFHDHEWEPPIIAAALESPAFYIGAQGSRRARMTREAELAELGILPASLFRIKGPIGLVPSARDARTLAVSVLAEVLAEVQR